MNSALDILASLDDAHAGWLLSAGRELDVRAGTTIIEQGKVVEELSIVLSGQLGASVGRGTIVTRLGPGALAGEMSFLDRLPASATVTAIEDARLLSIPHRTLDEGMQSDPALASQLYRAFAVAAMSKLRGLTSRFEAEQAAPADGSLDPMAAGLQALKDLLRAAEVEGRKAGGVPEATQRRVLEGFRGLLDQANDAFFGASPVPPERREQLGAMLQREVLPYVLLTRTAERMYSKPRGYAGDFFTIELLYRNEPGGAGLLGPLVDRVVLEIPAAQAVRNRRGLLARKIRETLAAHPDRPVHVTSLACGPATEVFDVYAELEDPSRLVTTLVDVDFQALAFVDEKRAALGLKRQIHLHNGNLVYLSLGREQIKLPPQDLMYSIGLIDYFKDKFVVSLMNWAYRLLAPGGKLILGNFHPRNPDRAFMDHVLDWPLIHRDEADMDRLFTASEFGRAATEAVLEPAGVNLFAECVR